MWVIQNTHYQGNRGIIQQAEYLLNIQKVWDWSLVSHGPMSNPPVQESIATPGETPKQQNTTEYPLPECSLCEMF